MSCFKLVVACALVLVVAMVCRSRLGSDKESNHASTPSTASKLYVTAGPHHAGGPQRSEVQPTEFKQRDDKKNVDNMKAEFKRTAPKPTMREVIESVFIQEHQQLSFIQQSQATRNSEQKASRRSTAEAAVSNQRRLVKSAGTCGLLNAESGKLPREALSFLEQRATSGLEGLTNIHIAAMGNFCKDEQLLFVGLNVAPADLLDSGKNAKNSEPSFSICFCNQGAFLNVYGRPYKVTAMIKDGKSLCMGKCQLTEELKKGGGEYTVMIEQVPNAPFRVRVAPSLVQTAAGSDIINSSVLEGDDATNLPVELIPGDLGLMVPGWICINCQSPSPHASPAPLSVFVSDVNIGCIHGIKTSFDSQSIERTDFQEHVPMYRSVTLKSPDGKAGTFILPEKQHDDSEELVKFVTDQLRGGDAVVEVCMGHDPKQTASQPIPSSSGVVGPRKGVVNVSISLSINGGSKGGKPTVSVQQTPALTHQ